MTRKGFAFNADKPGMMEQQVGGRAGRPSFLPLPHSAPPCA